MDYDGDRMIVRQVRDEEGTLGIDPSLDESWSELEKLRWYAAVRSLEPYLDIEVTEMGRRDNPNVRGLRKVYGHVFIVTSSNTWNDLLPFTHAWEWIKHLQPDPMRAVRDMHGLP